MIRYGTAFILSFSFALYWTPLMRKAALQMGIVDKPDGRLKKQEDAIPYLGGLAVFMAFLLTVGVLTDFGPDVLGLLLSGSIALMVGLLDDFGAMTPAQKLLGETFAALVLIKSGTYIKLAFLPVEFLRRLATLIPPPRCHLTRLHGVFSCITGPTTRRRRCSAGSTPPLPGSAADTPGTSRPYRGCGGAASRPVVSAGKISSS